MPNSLDNTDDSHDPYFNSPDEFDVWYEDSVSSDPDGDSPDDDDDYWWNRSLDRMD